MPSGEDVDLGGYDGIVDALIGSALVPQGRSIWEFGVDRSPGSKANKDYKSRTGEPLGEVPAVTTFVYVTPRRWAGAETWAKAKRAEGIWKDVWAISASELQIALEKCHATHIWFSEYQNIPSTAAETLENWWDKYCRPTNGLLSQDIVLAGRREAGAQLSRILADEDNAHIWIRANSTDDVLAFVACTVLALRDLEGSELYQRALVVFDASMLRYLDSQSNLLILLPFDESLVRQAELIANNHVILHTTNPGIAKISLPDIDIPEARDWLVNEKQVERQGATRLAGAASRSIPLFKQHVTGGAYPVLESVSGERKPLDATIRRAWLLGGWATVRSGDRSVLEQLSNDGVEAFLALVSEYSSGPDPLFSRIGETWKVSDVRSSFETLTPAIDANDLRAMEPLVQEILGAINPTLKLPLKDRWAAGIYGTRRIHSSQMRGGVANMLAALGGLGGGVRVESGTTLSGWAGLIVRALLQRANEDDSGELWSSLVDVLSKLGEAAPDEFLAAVRAGLSEGGSLRGSIFSQSDDAGIMATTSPHVYFLWALQHLAWSPRYVSDAVNIIAMLDDLDPGGKSGNRPLSSLIDILQPGIAQTSVDANTRVRILERLLTRHPKTAGKLVVLLIPDGNGFHLVSDGPEFRDWKPVRQGAATIAELYAEVKGVTKLAIKAAKRDPALWQKLVQKSTHVSPDLRTEIMHGLKDSRSDLDDATRQMLWDELNKIVRQHRQYSDAEWALSNDGLAPLLDVIATLEVPDALVRHRWLFDHTPMIGISIVDDDSAYYAEVGRLRQMALEEIWDEVQFEGICSFAKTVKTPWSVGSELSNCDLDPAPSLEDFIGVMTDADRSISLMATAYIGATTGGSHERLRALADQADGNPDVQASLLHLSGDQMSAWSAAADLGSDVEQAFWTSFQQIGLGADFELVNEAARHLKAYGRVGVALDLLALYGVRQPRKLDINLVRELLELFVSSDAEEHRWLTGYEIAKLLDLLAASGEVSDDEIALLEWRYLPIIERDGAPSALIKKIASTPSFFVELISLLYFPKNADRDTYERPNPEMIHNASRLLNAWNVVPGQKKDGNIDLDELIAWTDESRALLRDADRLNAGERHIGQVLAMTAEDEQDVWPPEAVREFLEQRGTDEIIRGFRLQTFNKRGVTSRSLDEGGAQERALATKYGQWATKCETDWPATARALRLIAQGYEHDANREDEETQRRLRGFDD
ncbi:MULTISPECIES: hypothetical protein [Nocardiaceae]|uniref:Uncharacterized protein n=1 Tax=Rhodococcoides kroppenstedtii TaxID=293050 RepID=A0ABS7NQH4_9NOCA|nr:MULTISPECIES: hypothetical protein [Rhodococcus]MBY6312450.1 hypothetical protein [Rhodococcus kroppenstedtii]MBY6320238.1 hypothetical protein [Rhodococcus kroppenstedtii]MBY6398741.1 hypothetical protein [Rhodococcus kroppenstedtii]